MDKRTANKRRQNSHRRNIIANRWRAIGDPCALCHKPIDYSLPAGHPMAFEIDEILPVSLGGDPLEFANTQPTHRTCNQRKGNIINRKKVNSLPLPLSRNW